MCYFHPKKKRNEMVTIFHGGSFRTQIEKNGWMVRQTFQYSKQKNMWRQRSLSRSWFFETSENEPNQGNDYCFHFYFTYTHTQISSITDKSHCVLLYRAHTTATTKKSSIQKISIVKAYRNHYKCILCLARMTRVICSNW